jgi:hypothetical protein
MISAIACLVAFAGLCAVLGGALVALLPPRTAKSSRLAAWWILAGALVAVAGSAVALEPGLVQGLTRRSDMERLGETSRPLIAAIEAFHARRSDGKTWTLQVWIPKFGLDLDGNRRFLYERDPARDRAHGATSRVGDWVYVPD